ncbi:protein of unknown function [Burkholderia multivorans]
MRAAGSAGGRRRDRLVPGLRVQGQPAGALFVFDVAAVLSANRASMPIAYRHARQMDRPDCLENFFTYLFPFCKNVGIVMFFAADAAVLKKTEASEVSKSGCSLAW